MKKTIIIFFTLIFLSVFTIIIFLSTKGYETDRFNTFLSQEINQTQPDLEINFNKIKIKFDFTPSFRSNNTNRWTSYSSCQPCFWSSGWSEYMFSNF